MKLFALIGYQWPPNWFPGTPFEEGDGVDPGWYTMHPPGSIHFVSHRSNPLSPRLPSNKTKGPEPVPPFVQWKKFYNHTWVSDIIGFETPNAREQYQQFLVAVASRYKNEKAIVAWIIGNEFGYIGLWRYTAISYYC